MSESSEPAAAADQAAPVPEGDASPPASSPARRKAPAHRSTAPATRRPAAAKTARSAASGADGTATPRATASESPTSKSAPSKSTSSKGAPRKTVAKKAVPTPLFSDDGVPSDPSVPTDPALLAEPAPVAEPEPVVEDEIEEWAVPTTSLPAEPEPDPTPSETPVAQPTTELPAFAATDAVEAGAGPVKRLSSTPSTASTLIRAALPFRQAGDAVPGTVLRLENVPTDADRVADYARVCGDTLGTRLPALYPHMLGFPLQMALMGDRHFPFPAIGLVHVTNDAVQRQPIPVGAKVDVEVHAAGPVPHRRGVTIDMVTRVMLDGELAWFSTSTYLRRGPSSLPTEITEKTEPPAPLPQRSIWRIPADQGRQYAAVSGDANPIHMSALSAKAFGFPKAIAHGMWTAAKVASAFENLREDVWRMQVQFRAPILLPSTVTLHSATDAAGDLAFEVRGKRDRLHLTGGFS